MFPKPHKRSKDQRVIGQHGITTIIFRNSQAYKNYYAVTICFEVDKFLGILFQCPQIAI